jgi:hypothetical protein
VRVFFWPIWLASVNIDVLSVDGVMMSISCKTNESPAG